MSRQWPVLLAVALLAAAAGYLVARQLGGSDDAAVGRPAVDSADLVGQRRPDFTHTGMDGRPVSMADFDGRVTLLNFWATWCAPCVEEMPMLSAVYETYGADGFVVVGIALDDPDRAATFARDLGVSYPVLLGRTDVVITGRRLGNSSGMLPYSVLIDDEGVIRWTYLGALDRSDLEARVRRLSGSP